MRFALRRPSVVITGKYVVEVKMGQFFDWTSLPWLEATQSEITPPYSPDTPEELISYITLTRYVSSLPFTMG